MSKFTLLLPSLGVFLLLFTSSLVAQTTPNSFPQKIHTGNDEKDEKLYQQQKLEWIKNNPDLYQSMNKGEYSKASDEQSPQYSPLPADFPKYQYTGNRLQDDLNYAIKKQQWILTHPQEYAALTQPQSGITEIRQEEYKIMSEEKRRHIEANPQSFRIIR